ncbi:unnamed protein product [Brachionus calyciflorus]|uniref:PH domain-containing protein n=1 Tax=Brachionus calyciflorus TaxID=104777 RepID=A0A814MI93_9BILA|nr:unnamed protein product [Brachionus calyciflorus]
MRYQKSIIQNISCLHNLRRLTLLDNNKKLYLESIGENNLPNFLIDLDNVDQIDLNDKKKTIYLRRIESNETCLLTATDKTILKEWLKVLCLSCGFHESYKIKTTKNNRTLRELLNKTSHDANKPNFKISSSILKKQYQNLIVGSVNVNFKIKQIVGSISPLVGSLTEHSTLNVLFPVNNKNKENKIQKLDYLCLEDCQSGADDHQSQLIDQTFSTKSLNDLTISEYSMKNKITYVPLEVVNSHNEVDIMETASHSSEESSINNYQKIYDQEVNKSFTYYSKKSNLSNVSAIANTLSDVPYTYLDTKRTEALKNTIKDLKKQF